MTIFKTLSSVPLPILVAETLAGRDDYCMKYLKANRAGTLIE